MFRFLSRLRFLLTATNQHGVHSPFVYNFVTKGLYRKGNRTLSVTENVLIKSISYFSYKKIGLVTDSNPLKKTLNSIFDDLGYLTFPFDIIYVNEFIKPFKTIGEAYIHNETMLLVEGIYSSKEHLARWNNLKKQAQVRVTIDLYHCGIVFFRREQAKEHFKIRI
ncbi:hypothetical protein ACFQZJ_12395 [Maribacter chungangensis]|uniref:Uncharacterized protein n=1 Tax=Maribacter chungangensis TaxID=1069117 RepID=A0ABW3B4W4_9FLAO